MVDKNEYVTVQEVATRLGVAISTIQRWARTDPEVRSFALKLQGRYYFHKPRLNAWLKAHSAA